MAVKGAFFKRFKSIILLVGSPSETERGNAANRAHDLCEENEVSVAEAFEGAFGAGEALARIAELQTHNDRLADEIRSLRGDESVLGKIWSAPQTRLSIALLVPLIALYSGVPVKVAFVPVTFYLCMAALFVYLLLLWCEVEIVAGVVVLRGLVVLIGVGFSAYNYASMIAVLILVISALLALSSAALVIVDKLSNSEERPYRLLRLWFAYGNDRSDLSEIR